MFEDKLLICKECGSEFTFSTSEQEDFSVKGYTNSPGRCGACRESRKARIGKQALISQTRYPSVCAECGSQTTVPFKPLGHKPIYCCNCYGSKKAVNFN
ncbi:zinc-binding protein [Heliobacillus mobilis]|uniref:Zinc-binding protein n=1 Tax=Heliobacterium mobile TaxID=28064 RepID=A0A6I3SM03_HELMO|nr:zinc-ribbon domain containing protein [Heliobacterium mobile]MTV49796.1 zinc-binding protein [Heliobacterium mobile]